MVLYLISGVPYDIQLETYSWSDLVDIFDFIYRFTRLEIMSGKKIVLVALDGSKNSEFALNWFLEKRRRPEDEVIGYYAWEHSRLPTFSLKAPFQPPTEEWEKIMEETLKQKSKVENSFSSTCQALKIPYKFCDENCAKPGEGIVAMAKKQNAELIVMGTRGLSTLRRTVLGSVSDFCLHHSKIPVAVVPTPEESACA